MGDEIMFKRKKSYPVVVAEARKAAEEAGVKTIVFQEGKIYDWCFEKLYLFMLDDAYKPLIQLLVCLPNGTVVQ